MVMALQKVSYLFRIISKLFNIYSTCCCCNIQSFFKCLFLSLFNTWFCYDFSFVFYIMLHNNKFYIYAYVKSWYFLFKFSVFCFLLWIFKYWLLNGNKQPLKILFIKNVLITIIINIINVLGVCFLKMLFSFRFYISSVTVLLLVIESQGDLGNLSLNLEEFLNIEIVF